jgi:hypothetical protein
VAGSFYSVSVKKCAVKIRARATDAKQVLWGWAGDYGSTKDPGAIELYGNGTRQGHGDHEIWEWNLSQAGVNSLMKGLVLQLSDKSYAGSRREQAAAKSLAHKVSAAATKLKRCKVR